MDFWNRLLGATNTPKRPPKPPANDPQTRLVRFRRVYNNVLELCDRPRNVEGEAPLLKQLHTHLDRVATLLREESRAPVPHICFQFASKNRIYAAISRVATVSQYEPIIRAGVAVFAALVDSEEEDFLANGHFAKSLMLLVRKVVDSGDYLIEVETETAILELLFTIAAKIRLQPEILPVWFQSTVKPEHEDVFLKEKKSFVGITQKDDFPLCYLLIDRVHHEGRIGDFARTGLLYVFEATGRSNELEEWVINSDLPTLMASGLGALYSQLSRELSILHADAELPAVLAMSDYATTHPRATAESAFSERHKSHMATFLSYLAFWQDVLDHCRSSDVKQTLLDHFQILFLQQLLYPSLLQSSDTDAGSSIAVLTYMTAMLESLEYPDLINMMLKYLLAIDEDDDAPPSTPQTPRPSDGLPRSPTTIRRRQSLLLLSVPKDPNDAVEPALFNLVDLITNNVGSRNSQTVYAALKLASTLTTRHKRYALENLLKTRRSRSTAAERTVGALELEIEKYMSVAASLHQHYALDTAYSRHCEDVRYCIEAQVSLLPIATPTTDVADMGSIVLASEDPLMRTMVALLRTFYTNSIDVNLELSQALIAIFQCVELQLDHWIALKPSAYRSDELAGARRPWQASLDNEQQDAWSRVCKQICVPTWSSEAAPILFKELDALSVELQAVRSRIPNLDQLIAGRKVMLQASGVDATALSDPPSAMGSPEPRRAMLDVPNALQGISRDSSRSSLSRGRAADGKASDTVTGSSATSPIASRTTSTARANQASKSPPSGSFFRPPPPETPSTTDVLMQMIAFPSRAEASAESTSEGNEADDAKENRPGTQSASLNHVLTNVVVLQEFVLELTAVLQVRAAVLGDREIRSSA
ncbi:Putative FHF complex subunit HOOK interacting protein [Septoria linicola]|uniref:FHF complex subunit HOOK interacting protein n=1 Tax=Septoria linicola TaxID=215465 RepID=A0A9Q9AUL2_9PEZI|nr:Putative FHF complex subunit HOOK interacting protein [Septoria linicola]